MVIIKAVNGTILGRCTTRYVLSLELDTVINSQVIVSKLEAALFFGIFSLKARKIFAT